MMLGARQPQSGAFPQTADLGLISHAALFNAEVCRHHYRYERGTRLHG